MVDQKYISQEHHKPIVAMLPGHGGFWRESRHSGAIDNRTKGIAEGMDCNKID